ncbi:MAG: hypothetical protein WBZ20_10935 [Nitrososphaeraceae archaeon]
MSEYAEMIRAVQYDFIRRTTQYTLMGISSWDPVAKAHMMAYDKQLKDLSTMYDEEQIL